VNIVENIRDKPGETVYPLVNFTQVLLQNEAHRCDAYMNQYLKYLVNPLLFDVVL